MGFSLSDIPRAMGELRLTVSSLSLTKYSALGLILVLAVGLRLLAIRYGAYISEFDPYLQFYAADFVADQVLEKGAAGILDFFQWHSSITWYPEGVNIGQTYFPGVPMAGAFFYLLLAGLGIDISLQTVLIYFPLVTAVLTILFAYLLARRLGGEIAGLLTALFFSASPSFMARSGLGWFDTESMGMLAMVVALYFFVEAMSPNRGRRGRCIFAFLAAGSAGVMAASWGAFLYLFGTLALFSILASFLGLFPEDFRRPQAMMMVLTVIFAAAVPRNGLDFIYHPVAILMYVAVVLPFFSSYIRLRLSWSQLPYWIALFLGVLLLTPQVLEVLPTGISGRILAVVNPFTKFDNPLVQSVQEHVGAGLVAFFINTGWGFLLPFVAYGMYLTVRDADLNRLMMLVFGASSLYFASSFARLGTLASPFVAMLGAYGIYRLVDPMYTHLLAGVQKGKLRRRMGRGSRSYALGTFVLIVVLATVLVYPPARDSGDSPVTIASASAGVRTRVPDWLEALEWLRLNTPEDAVVAAWWDYGYWISFIGERKSLADNGTINQTRIEQLATMFLSDEETALEILEDLEAEYVAIFIVPFPLRNQQGQIQGYCFVQCIGTAGEEGKFVQMARIAGMNENRFINATGSLQPPFFDTFLGKLIPYDRQRKTQQGVDLYVRSEHYPMEPSEDFPLTLVFSSSHESIAEVVIYKIERYSP